MITSNQQLLSEKVDRKGENKIHSIHGLEVLSLLISWSNSNVTLRKENVYSDFQDAPRSDNHWAFKFSFFLFFQADLSLKFKQSHLYTIQVVFDCWFLDLIVKNSKKRECLLLTTPRSDNQTHHWALKFKLSVLYTGPELLYLLNDQFLD